MMYKGPKQKYFEIPPIPFHNYDPINAHINNTEKLLVALHSKPQLKQIYTQF